MLTFPSPHQQQEAFTSRLYQDVGGQGGARTPQQQQQHQQLAAPAAGPHRPPSPAEIRAAADTYSDAWIPSAACKQVCSLTFRTPVSSGFVNCSSVSDPYSFVTDPDLRVLKINTDPYLGLCF